MLREQNQLVQEGEAQINVVHHQMESEQRAFLMILETVSQDREVVCQEEQNFRDYLRCESLHSSPVPKFKL